MAIQQLSESMSSKCSIKNSNSVCFLIFIINNIFYVLLICFITLVTI